MQLNHAAPLDSTVFIVDDDAGILKSLSTVMEIEAIPTRAYSSAESFLDHFDSRLPGCLVVDMRMPGISGLELLQCLRATGNQMPVIMITGHGDVPTAVETIKLGAIEFLQKPVNPRILVAKIREALEMDTARRASQADVIAIRELMSTLTNREQELLQMLAAGLSNKQIADQMGIAIKTAEHHRAHVMAKTRAANVADLVRMKMLVGTI